MSRSTKSINVDDLKVYQNAIRNVVMNTLELIDSYNPENKVEILYNLAALGSLERELKNIFISEES